MKMGTSFGSEEAPTLLTIISHGLLRHLQDWMSNWERLRSEGRSVQQLSSMNVNGCWLLLA